MSVMSLDYLGRQGITDPRVLEALRKVPRARFVPGSERASAYANRALPIGHGQTISQPYVVAYMTQALDIHTTDRVLEVGTGCGYQTAILAELSEFVFTIEIVPELARKARETLDQLGYHTVRTRLGNGRDGWPEEAPFDAIMVTAAGSSIPAALIEQLNRGGRLIMPVGSSSLTQELVLLRKDERGQVSRNPLLPVRFVPLTG